MSVPSSVPDLIEDSLALERSGDFAGALTRAREALDLARSVGEPGAIAAALVGVARFRHRLGQYPAAGAMAEAALTLAPTETPAQADALLMLAMSAAGTELLAEAEGYYRRAADLVSEGDLNGASDLFAVYLTCHHVLRACGDGRAGEVLATARAALLERAALIGDEEMRRSFLENVPHHRALLHELTICPSCR